MAHLADVAECRKVEAQFWAKVDRDGPVLRPELGNCWLWLGWCDEDGYGMFDVPSRGKRRASHVAYEIARKKPVPKGKSVLHRCDNPPCVRPSHLRRGTQLRNMHEKVARGRHVANYTYCPERKLTGALNPAAKLTSKQVEEIRFQHKGGVSIRKLSRDYAVSFTTVWSIVRGYTWKIQ